MKPNKRDLRAFVRFDNIGRIVPGSLVLRRNKPKNGHWHEIVAYECCNPAAGIPEPHPTTTTTTSNTTGAVILTPTTTAIP